MQKIAELIKTWEHKNGESFVDYFESELKASTFMTWCYGKGYLNNKQYNEWLHEYVNDNYEADCANYFVSSYGNDISWAVVQYDDSTDETFNESYNKECEILGEFIESIDIYKQRFGSFIENN